MHARTYARTWTRTHTHTHASHTRTDACTHSRTVSCLHRSIPLPSFVVVAAVFEDWFFEGKWIAPPSCSHFHRHALGGQWSGRHQRWPWPSPDLKTSHLQCSAWRHAVCCGSAVRYALRPLRSSPPPAKLSFPQRPVRDLSLIHIWRCRRWP